MSSKRPTQIPRWAWGAAATLVQPPSGSAEAGFSTRDEPPAQWFNWQLNAIGGWIDFLRGPDVEKWTRVSWPGTPATDHFNAPSSVVFDVDTVTSDAGATDGAFRMAVIGMTSAPAAKMFVSQTGAQWEARTNIPASREGPFALKALSTGRWLLGCQVGGVYEIFYAAADDGAAVGPLGANGNTWTAATLPAGLDEVKRFAELGGAAKLCAATSTTGVYSADNGATWVDCTFTTTPANNGLDVVSDGVKYVWISQDAEVYVSTDGVTFAATVTLPAGSGSWRLCAGGTGEVLAYRIGSTTVVDVYRSEDSGSSWTAITPAAASPTRITQVAHRDGVWIATVSRSPWMWVSNDLTSWRALAPPVDTSAIPAALYNIRWDGGAWVAVGNGVSLQCGRASDPATGAYVRNDAPSTFADAGSLRGLLISTTAPTNGQVLVWNSSTFRWTPGSAGSSSPTTTRGDLIRRGASADERLPAATANTFVGGDGTDVTTRTVAQVRTSLKTGSAGSSVAGSSFTPANGVGTATASTLTLTIANMANVWADIPSLLYAHGGDPWNVTVTARLVSVTGGTGDSYPSLALRNSAGDNLLLVQARGSDGLVSVYGNGGGDLASGAVTMPFDGTGAFRITLRDGAATVYQSTDSGTSWRPIYRGTPPIPTTDPWTFTRVAFALYQGASPGGTVTVQWADVTVGATL